MPTNIDCMFRFIKNPVFFDCFGFLFHRLHRNVIHLIKPRVFRGKRVSLRRRSFNLSKNIRFYSKGDGIVSNRNTALGEKRAYKVLPYGKLQLYQTEIPFLGRNRLAMFFSMGGGDE